jgi:hypothetical protein
MKKLYVVVRDDLSFPQKAVQAGHAIAAWMLKFPDSVWKNDTLVLLKADDKKHLTDIWSDLWRNETAAFFEPDIGDEITAIACLGGNKIVKKLPLLV